MKTSLDTFLDKCGDQAAKSDTKVELGCAQMAEIEERLTGKAPECPTGQNFDGCATECSYKTCSQAIENKENSVEIDFCEGTRLND